MVLRAPYETTESISRPSRPVVLNLDRLAAVIRDANRPVAIQALAREAVRAMIVADGPLRTYVPGRTYEQGERVRLLDGRLGDVVALETGGNPDQGTFDIIAVRLRDGDVVRLAANVTGAPQAASPDLVADDTVDMLLLGREQEIVRQVRQAMAADPRFITLYYGDGEYGCLREFFPPMSPDVLDAALALLLDELFDQIPLARVTDLPLEDQGLDGRRREPAESLFSTDRLERTFSSSEQVQDPERAVFEAVRSLWQRADRQGEAWDDDQLARVFLQPLLRSLGWSSVPLLDNAGRGDSKESASPAYALCADEFAASELYTGYDDGGAIDRWALALAYVAGWGQDLDQPVPLHSESVPTEGADDRGPEMVPSHRLVSGLRRTQVQWGIVTNGRIWRLVSREANSLARAYYEVDLTDVFDGLASGEAPDRERWQVFRRWWLLFRQASYVRNRDGRCLLEHLREQEPQAERQTRSLLRERLLTRALPAVAGGFVAYRRQRLGIAAEQPSTLQEIHRASVLLLTRVLFVLIAEAKGLLPLSDPAYRPHSLTTQAEWASERVRRSLPLSSGVYTTARYDVVVALLHRLSKGDAEKSLPTYGRLLYNPTECEQHRFLERTRLSDHSLGYALDAIFRGIDYGELDARDLIGVCSALVGSQLSVLDADAGEVLITRQGDERVRSETYPDFVVTSIVEQALEPVLRARSELFVRAMDDVVEVRRRLRRTLDRRRRSLLHADWEMASRRARDAFLGLRLCDPAMGAGDFLLSAVDVLTDGVIDCLLAYHRDHPDIPRDWNPIYRLLDEASQNVSEEMVRQDVTSLPRGNSDAVTLSRLLAQRTLFGVADDPLAVEVAKVGLWLHTFAPGVPLPFLDHHLAAGNALLSADLSDVVAQLGLTSASEGVLEDVRTLYALTDRVDTTPLDVRWSAAQFERVTTSLSPYRRLLNLVVWAALGSAQAAAQLDGLDRESWQETIVQVPTAAADDTAGADHCFHWVLAFPEVYADLAEGVWRDTPGFDLIFGAPPWTDVTDESLASYYRQLYSRDAESYNVHHAYLALARKLVKRPGGRTAYVLSKEWLASPTGGI